MIYFLIIFFSVFFSFSLYSKKFTNNFKLIFIFGKKGSGKSTLMVKWMLRDLKHGWHVYTDMPDVHIPGVHYFKTMDLAKYAPPPRSVIYLDEVGLSMDNRNYASFPAGMRDFFALQRKFSTRVIVNSQSYDCDKKIRDRVDSMILQTNIGNVIGISRPIRRTVTLTEANSQAESRIADQLKFAHIWNWKLTWLPRYHKYFESFNAPARELIPSTLPAGEQLSELRKNFRRR